jgi:LysM repeat protein
MNTGAGISRRAFVGAAAGATAGALLLARNTRPVTALANNDSVRHLVWVWQFSVDAAPNAIGADLRDHNLSILLKTHDGVEWMSRYDKSPFAVSGPKQTETLARYYEDAGVPFHAWAVIKGIDPIREAHMAADVLSAGARSLFLDVEPHDGFWRGTPQDAMTFGQELKRLQPNGWIVTSIDPRPWVVSRTPVAEFASFSNMLAPQQYWHTFNTKANHDRFAEVGMPVPPGGITPEFLNDISHKVLAPYGRALTPVGQGSSGDLSEWHRFIDHAYSLGDTVVSTWRYGVTNRGLFPLLRDKPPRVPPPPPPPVVSAPAPAPVVDAPPPAPTGPEFVFYTVQPGDTLTAIAARHGTSVNAIVEANGIANPHLISVGQQLQIPVSGGGGAPFVSSNAAPSPSTYTVQPGDTLTGIAARHGTSVNQIVSLNGISNPHLISIGQVLRLT